MHVELDDVGARRERRLHRGESVLEVGMLGRIEARCRAGVVFETLAPERLRHAAVREQDRCAASRRGGAGPVIEIDEARKRDEDGQGEQ